jgi:hypothetical protein
VLAIVLVAEAAGLASATHGNGPDTGARLVDASRVEKRDERVAAPRTPRPSLRENEPAFGQQVHDRPSLGRGATVRPTIEAVAKTTTIGAYRGRSHVWIPSLGINRSVSAFPCSRSRAPDNLIYRWGCAGRNNVYLLGHAHSVFKPLHDAYASGRLKKGMQVVYADAKGRVTTYSVVWWKVVRPTAAAAWAWAAQPTPSMTLQTCVGAKSEYRLMVRLVATG